MAYKRVTAGERAQTSRWLQEGETRREIARRLGRSAGSISREIFRNMGLRGYRPKQADEKARFRGRRTESRRFTDAVRTEAEVRLKEGWTPAMICGRARLEDRPSVCAETIYKRLYRDAKVGGTLWKHLPRAKRKRHRRCPRQDGRGRGRIPNQRRIETRPAEVETRPQVGHWEGDLIDGAHGTGHLATLVERVTRYSLVGRTNSKEAEEVARRTCAVFRALPAPSRRSVTYDNGKEFARHEEIASALTLEVFFAHPYHSWEWRGHCGRGTNENTNGLIRRLYPKKPSFAGIGEAELLRIESFLNDRPRKCLGWATPRERIAAFLGRAP